MTCSKAQDSVMLYHEGRLKPLKSLALHRHINKCGDCREFFLAMDLAAETGSEGLEPGLQVELPADDFTLAVMAKIYELPAYAPKTVEEARPKASNDWLRLAGCLYVLVLAVCFAVLLNTELIDIPYPSIETGAWANAFFSNLIQAGQYAASNTAVLPEGLAYLTLAIAVVLGLTLGFMLQKEKLNLSKKHE